ncbi:hypothetical protein GFS31_00870 [Leptolyngbya sp. BL0902]|uniref:hypothetical protein n=1 Tax=Leptolyngbya sp. BL0902 TaxID=1115757 RepID=UPI0018E7570A|nr:hypothetical protein [Leptolyngbya sp. BL0902]QQE63422.1 hypothetical protein GFS31_00870 [Leptolyngbya sp. BL0902]
MFFEYLRPRSLEPSQEVTEYLILHQAAQDFRLEVEYRQQFEAYCQWYYQTAAENQASLDQMQGEINLRSWFSR